MILIQEWWGLSDNIKNTAGRLAKEGYNVLAPDLYRGKLTTDPTQAGQWMNELNFPDAVHQDLAGGADYLKGVSPRVAVMGFCMGGALTLAAAVHVKSLNAALCFYGIPPASLADPKNIRVPIQFHFAKIDNWCTPEAVDALEKILKNSSVKWELYRYDAQHAFFNETRPDVYEPKSARLAWERSLKFLKENL